MIKRNIVLLLVWNFVWLGFAVDQIQISVEALQQSNNIYGDKVVVDRNGTKFLVDKNRLKNDKFDTDHTCGMKIYGKIILFITLILKHQLLKLNI